METGNAELALSVLERGSGWPVVCEGGALKLMGLRMWCDSQRSQEEMRNKDQVRTFDCCCERDGEPWRAWQRGVTGPDFSCIGLLAARGEPKAGRSWRAQFGSNFQQSRWQVKGLGSGQRW